MSLFKRLFGSAPSSKAGQREQEREPLTPPPMSRVAAYRVGDRIAGRYAVQRIMEGGLGKVFVVAEGGDPFVLKTLKPGNPKVKEFLEEARTWVRLGRHENIVPAFWVDHVAGMPCVAAEYIRPDDYGRSSVRDYMMIAQPSLTQIARWCAQFCYGIEHALGRGLIAHRDIKPENLLVSRIGALQITDFGISTASSLEWVGDASEDKHSGPVSGTPAYMAPEQWLGQAQDFRTDAYAFGLVIYELCFGHLPWTARNIAELRRAHLTAEVEVPKHPLQSLIAGAVQRDRQKRWASPASMLDALRQAAETAGISLPPRPIPPDEEREELFARAFLSATGNPEHAFAAVKLLTERWPQFAPGWTQLGRLFYERGRLRDAGFATQRAIDLDGTVSESWNNLGLIFHKAGHHEQAVEVLKRAIDCDPSNTGPMINMMGPLMDLDRSADAIPWLKRAGTIAPDKVGVWVNLGSLYNLNGDHTGARASFSRALTCVADHERPALLAKIREVFPL